MEALIAIFLVFSVAYLNEKPMFDCGDGYLKHLFDCVKMLCLWILEQQKFDFWQCDARICGDVVARLPESRFGINNLNFIETTIYANKVKSAAGGKKREMS